MRLAEAAEKTALVDPAARDSSWSGIWVGVLLLAANAGILARMMGSWFDDLANMEHGMLVPLAAGYMVWLRRDELKLIPTSTSWWGIILALWGAVQATVATAAQWVWAARISFLIGLAGAIWTLYGWRMVRELTYPLLTLLLMIAPPSFLYERLTLQLQLLASRLGAFFLEAFGYSVLRTGNILELVGEKLQVAEACSGIRSLFSLLFLVVFYNYFFVPNKWHRIILVIAVAPIAILCNAGRILLTGVVGQYNSELARGMLHAAFGYTSLVLGACVAMLLHRSIVMIPRLQRRHDA